MYSNLGLYNVEPSGPAICDMEHHTVDNNTRQTKFLHTKTRRKTSTKTKGQAVN